MIPVGVMHTRSKYGNAVFRPLSATMRWAARGAGSTGAKQQRGARQERATGKAFRRIIVLRRSDNGNPGGKPLGSSTWSEPKSCGGVNYANESRCCCRFHSMVSRLCISKRSGPVTADFSNHQNYSAGDRHADAKY